MVEVPRSRTSAKDRIDLIFFLKLGLLGHPFRSMFYLLYFSCISGRLLGGGRRPGVQNLLHRHHSLLHRHFSCCTCTTIRHYNNVLHMLNGWPSWGGVLGTAKKEGDGLDSGRSSLNSQSAELTTRLQPETTRQPDCMARTRSSQLGGP